MEISNIKINLIRQKPTETLFGFASVIIDGILELKSLGIHLRKTEPGIRITFPARKLVNGQLIFFFQFNDEKMEKRIAEAVEQELNRLGVFDFEDEGNEEQSKVKQKLII